MGALGVNTGLPTTWTTRLGLPLLVLSAFLLFESTQRGGVQWGGDSALYVMHARNLATGQPYAKTPYVYDDEAWMEGTPTFPPALPLVLTPLVAARGVDLPFLLDFNRLLLALALIPIYFLLRARLSPGWTLLACVFFTGNIFPLGLIHNIFSEPLFLLVSFTGLAVIQWIYQTERDRSGWLPWGLAAGALAAAAYFTRSIGGALILGLCLYDLWRNRRPSRFAFVAGLVFVGALAGSNLLLHSDSNYVRTQFRFDLTTNLANMRELLRGSFALFYGLPGGRWPRVALWAVTTALAAWGFLRKLRREGPSAADLYAAATFGVLFFYWMWNTRYLIPLLPLYLMYLAEVLRDLWAGSLRIPAGRPLAAAVLLLMAAAIPGAYRDVAGPLADGVHIADYRQAVEFIRSQTAPEARIVSDSARYLALFTDRPSLFYPIQKEAPDIAQYLARTRPDYVLVSKHHAPDQERLAPALRMLPPAVVVFENQRYALYRLKPS